MADNQQGFPIIQAPLTDEERKITQVWLQLLITLWKRTGSGSGGDVSVAIDYFLSLLGNPLQAEVAALQSDIDAVEAMFQPRLPSPEADLLPLALADQGNTGAWTPILTASTTAPTGTTFSTQSGSWFKLGNLCVVYGYVVISNLGAGGVGFLQVANLPFKAKYGAKCAVVVSYITFSGANYRYFCGSLDPGATVLSLQECGNNVLAQFVLWGAMAVSAEVNFTIVYNTGA